MSEVTDTLETEGSTEFDSSENIFGDEQPPTDNTTEYSDDSDPTFTVVIDGREQEVPMDELLKGYQRQSDYTRKTQDVARQRDDAAQALQLVQQLQEDPEGTLEVLRRHLVNDGDNGEDIDPVEARLAQHDKFIAEQQDADFEVWLQGEIHNLQDKYPSLDGESTIQWALDNNIPNLEAAYLHREAAAYHQATRDEKNKEAATRKRNSPPVAGRSVAGDSVARPSRDIVSVSDALDAALEDLGEDWFE